MGFNVDYSFALNTDPSITVEYGYHRGKHGWDSDPTGVPGEGLFDLSHPSSPYTEWDITIIRGEVRTSFKSEKFYTQYMSRMLHQLKNAVPSLRGVVTSYLGLSWSVTDVVKEHNSYIAALSEVDSGSTKRKRDEEQTSSRGDEHKRSKSGKIIVSMDYSCVEHEKPSLPDVSVEFNFSHPINYKNISVNTWAVPIGDPGDSNPYEKKRDARAATWQCSLKFWNEWQAIFKEKTDRERKEVKELWHSAIKDGSWKD